MYPSTSSCFSIWKNREDDCCRFIVFIDPLQWKVIPKWNLDGYINVNITEVTICRYK